MVQLTFSMRPKTHFGYSGHGSGQIYKENHKKMKDKRHFVAFLYRDSYRKPGLRSEIGLSGSKKNCTLLRSKPQNHSNNNFHAQEWPEKAHSSRSGNHQKNFKKENTKHNKSIRFLPFSTRLKDVGIAICLHKVTESF